MIITRKKHILLLAVVLLALVLLLLPKTALADEYDAAAIGATPKLTVSAGNHTIKDDTSLPTTLAEIELLDGATLTIASGVVVKADLAITGSGKLVIGTGAQSTSALLVDDVALTISNKGTVTIQGSNNALQAAGILSDKPTSFVKFDGCGQVSIVGGSKGYGIKAFTTVEFLSCTGNISITGGAGIHAIWGSAYFENCTGDVTINGGSGLNIVGVETHASFKSCSGDMTINGGTGTNASGVGAVAGFENCSGKVTIKGGSGEDAQGARKAGKFLNCTGAIDIIGGSGTNANGIYDESGDSFITGCTGTISIQGDTNGGFGISSTQQSLPVTFGTSGGTLRLENKKAVSTTSGTEGIVALSKNNTSSWSVTGDTASPVFDPAYPGCLTANSFTANIVGISNPLIISLAAQPQASISYDDYTLTYSTTTLTDLTTGISVTGQMTNYAKLTVRERVLHAEGACPACDEIRARIAAGELIVLNDISVSGGYTGELEVSIPVGEQYNGQTVTILHCKNGVLESVTCVVNNGVAEGTFKKLSPFAVVQGANVSVPENVVVNPPKTGDASYAWAGLLMISAAVALFVIALLYLKCRSSGN